MFGIIYQRKFILLGKLILITCETLCLCVNLAVKDNKYYFRVLSFEMNQRVINESKQQTRPNASLYDIHDCEPLFFIAQN